MFVLCPVSVQDGYRHLLPFGCLKSGGPKSERDGAHCERVLRGCVKVGEKGEIGEPLAMCFHWSRR